AMPPAWLHTRRAELAAATGAAPPLEESLRQIRTVLAETYGLPLEQLECAQLRSALTRTMRVPGATPDRVAQLLISRSAPDRRELTSGRDPIAVLVWAATHHALPALADEAAHRGDVARSDAATELRRLDSALARQRESRLAAAETTSAGPIVAVLGQAPAHPAGLGIWRRATSAILDYRDAAGVYDHDSGHPDPLTRTLGPRPSDPDLAAHYDQVVGIVTASRASLVLADLARSARVKPPRAGLAVEGLAGLDLQRLEQLQAASP